MRRAVIVEDHQLVGEMFAGLLRDAAEVKVAALARTVAEGIEACRRERPDLVLLDWMLPDGRGFQVHDALREEAPEARWMLVSSHEHMLVVREAHTRGFGGCVLKQCALSSLRAGLREVLRGGTYYCRRSTALLAGEPPVGRVAGLARAELMALRFYALGYNYKEIGSLLSVAAKTAQNYLAVVRAKLGTSEPAALIAIALREEVVTSAELGTRPQGRKKRPRA